MGIFELEPFTPSDIDNYEACFGSDASVSTVAVDGGATGPQVGEAALDIEVAAGLAPASAITVFSGPNSGTGPIDTYTQMVDDPSIKVLTTSWGQCEGAGGIDPSEQQAETTLFEQAASQGQTVMAAAGDSGSSDCYFPPHDDNPALSVDDPADQPDVTGVGGTTLTGAAPDAPTESVWNGGPSLGAGGGGNSADFAAPSWQQIPEAQSHATLFTCGSGSQQCREVPDVSASSDPDHGDVIFFDGQWQRFGGTSAAAPLWAALTAVSNQGCAAPAGFLNQQLYPAGAGSQPPFNDITVGNNDLFDPGAPPASAVYPATPHYDLASGWGSPKAAAVMGLLSGSSAGCPSVTGSGPRFRPRHRGHHRGHQRRRVRVRPSGGPLRRGGRPGDPAHAHLGDRDRPGCPFGGPAGGHRHHLRRRRRDQCGGADGGVHLRVPPGPGGGASQGTHGRRRNGHRVRLRLPRGHLGPVRVDAGRLHGHLADDAPGPGTPRADRRGTADVTVESPDGISPVVAGDRYTYALPGYWLVASDGGVFAYGARRLLRLDRGDGPQPAGGGHGPHPR